MAVEEPRAGIVGEETNRDIIPSVTNTHDIPNDRVVKVVRRVTSAADYMEVVPMQMNRMLSKDAITVINLALFLTAIREHSQVHQRHLQEWSTQHSCLDRDRRCCLPVLDPTLSLHHSGSGATRVHLGVQS